MYRSCPRKFYYRYISKLPEEDTFHAIRGRVVHKVCEEVFAWEPNPASSYSELLNDMRKRAHDILRKEWLRSGIDQMASEGSYPETSAMIDRFLLHQKWKMDGIYLRYQDAIKAWRFAKPKFTELHLVDHKLKCHGYIDAVLDLGEDGFVLVDYKTSSVFKFPLTKEYQCQLYIYALLYKRCKGLFPDHVALEYLTTGQISVMPVTEELCEESENLIIDIHSKTHSYAITDYPPNTGYRFCNYCGYKDICFDEQRGSNLTK